MSPLILRATHLAAVENLAALLTVHAAAAPLAAEGANTDFLKHGQPGENGGTGGRFVHLFSKRDNVALLHVLYAAAVHFLYIKCKRCTLESG